MIKQAEEQRENAIACIDWYEDEKAKAEAKLAELEELAKKLEETESSEEPEEPGE